MTWYEPENWQKLGKSPESPEVDKYPMFRENPCSDCQKKVKSCKKLQKYKKYENCEVTVTAQKVRP
jgi:hypothetical protein